MGLKYSNFGKAKVAIPPDDIVGLSFTVAAGKGLDYPSLGSGDHFYGVFKNAAGDREIVKIEARNGDQMTIAVGGRGLDGTTPKTWAAGDYFVAGLVNAALQETISSQSLQALAGLVTSSDKVPYFTGAGLAALFDLTPFGRALLDDADAAAMRATLGVSTDFKAGTSTVFYQATAPLGWLQDTSTLDHALRVTGGAGGSAGGSVDFTAAFKSQAVTGSNSDTTLNSTQLAQHNHPIKTTNNGTGGGGGAGAFVASGGGSTGRTEVQDTLTSQPHNHPFTGNPINLAVRYLNMIRATKQ